MITEDFFPIHQVVQHSELLLKKTVKFVIEKWKEKGMPFYASITDVIDNSVLILCLSKEYLIDFNLCYLSIPLTQERKRSTPFIMVKFYKYPKNKYFKEEGISQIGEKYYIDENYSLLDKNQEVIKSDLFNTQELLINSFFEAVAEDIQMAE
ncbi:MAG: hypothetical protein WCR02_12500 [Sphaerochaetaceae bacterium]